MNLRTAYLTTVLRNKGMCGFFFQTADETLGVSYRKFLGDFGGLFDMSDARLTIADKDKNDLRNSWLVR